MNINDFMRVTAYFRINGVSDAAVMVWDYRLIGADSPATLITTGSFIASSFIERYYTPFTSLFSNRCEMTQISIRAWATPTDGYDVVGNLWSGSGSTGMMPLTVTLALRLVRSNFSMRNGRKAYPAVLTSLALADASVDPAVVTSVNETTEEWATTSWFVEAGENELQFGEYVVREPASDGVNPTVFYPVLSYSSPYFGTQNTRRQ